MSDFLHDAKQFADSHEQQVDRAVEGAGKEVDERTGNKYDKEVEKGEQAVEHHIGEGGRK